MKSSQLLPTRTCMYSCTSKFWLRLASMHIVPPYHPKIELENGNDHHQSPKRWPWENSPWFVANTRAKGGGDDHRKFQIGWTRMDMDVIIGCGWMITKGEGVGAGPPHHANGFEARYSPHHPSCFWRREAIETNTRALDRVDGCSSIYELRPFSTHESHLQELET